jgi:ABC-2 type transport system permease protein
LKTILLIMLNEMRKGFMILWNYRFNSISELLVMAILFIGIGFFKGDGQLEPALLAPILLGYVMWYYAQVFILNMSFNLTEEAEAGTLEQMYMSPAPMGLILVGRVFAALITASLQILLVTAILMLLLDIRFPLYGSGLLVFLLTLFGLFGFSFFIAGLTLIFKHVSGIANLLINLLVLVNGTLVPVAKFPPWLATFATTLPTTQGIVVLRNVLLNGQSLADAWKDGSLVLLVVNSTLYCALGWLFLQWAERTAKRQGSLGQY